ncbi:major capsid protein [Mycobacterium phage Cracklewink]|uniref:Major capsid protein n=1 Tax=Mycobacterium phage Bipper TaxID=1805457 RepID=A0A142F2E2_9CAUD|nr:major head protein [Mycobacterium phage Bipper]AMQ66949.1 major capsid protein [Mycobacterium phage Bipper]QDF19300.1 major capsid protein [Mycobacterium phage Cracklewink]
MEERLKRLIALRAKAGEELDKLVAERQAITDLVKEEAREDLTPEEDTEFRAKVAAIKAKQTECSGLDERIQELAEEIERSGKLSEGAAAVRRAQQKVESVKEARAYEKGNGHSYFADLIRSQRGLDGSGDAAERLARHAKDVASDAEYRDMDTVDGNGGFFVPPVWLVNQFIELPRAGRAYANLIPSEPLPAKTNSINIPKVTAGTAVAFQTADNQPVNEQDMDDAAIEAKVRTIAGQADVAIQLLDQSPISFDEMIFRDLIADFATKVDKAVLTGTGNNGQVLGVHATPGITTIAAATVDVAGFYSAVADGIQRIHTQRFLPPSHIVMHPRRWAWLTAELGNDGRPLVLPAANNPSNAVATMAGVVSEQVVGQLQGLPVVTDPNIGTTYGTGTNEDVVYVQRSADLALYESPIRSRVLPEVGSGTLTVRLQVYGYIAFTAERYPQSVVEITGLTAPTF